MGLQTSYYPLNVCVFCLLMLLQTQLWCPPCMAQVGEGAPIPGGISDMDFNALLNDLRGSKFFTGAAVLGYLARPYLRPSVTLLIPTDKSLAQAMNFAPKDYPDLIKFHILQKNFNFKQLRLLPVGTWLPTALPSFGVQVTSNTAANLSLDTAQIISPNLCPSLISSFITCQGISAILNPKTPNPPIFAGAPTSNLAPSSSPNPPTFAGPPTSNLAPSSSPPIFLPPSFSPTFSPLTSPSQSTSPSSSPSFSPSTSTSPSTISSSPTSSPPSPLPLPPSSSTSSLPLPLPPSDSPSLSPATLPTQPPFTIIEPGGFVPEPAPSAAAASVHIVGAYMMACLGAYMLVLSHGL